MRIVIAFVAYCCGTLKAADVVEAKCSLARNKKFCDEQIELYEEKENKTGKLGTRASCPLQLECPGGKLLNFRLLQPDIQSRHFVLSAPNTS